MTFFYFYPFNFLFIFILTNIFLAIINQTYSDALRQASELQYAQGGGSDEEDVEIMRALFYCFKLKRGKTKGAEAGDHEKKAKGDMKEANSHNGGIGNDHLEVFDKLALNL